MPLRRFYRRRFLNRRGFNAGAYVLADCRVESYRPVGRAGGKPEHSIDAYLTVADCGRIATLDFCVHRDAEVANALYKARLLRDVLVDFTAALEAAVDGRRALSDG
jgi:hypothetical protein